MSQPIRLTVNGTDLERSDLDDAERLLDTLRWRLGLKGTKEGCRTGDCGACTVLVDGESTLSCLTLTREVEGTRITTIEGVRGEPAGPNVLTAFGAEPALQCGYCTPGFVMALTGLLQEEGSTHRTSNLVDELEGNLCRCTGYRSIIRAIGALGDELR
ncbi:MAG: (2Fe-2S)-binding protein [Thermoplasmata archaeon]|nr:(2Fe-2S)-binding protein [Thermoplasmata archaeon]